jgi:hypothetical protein
MTEPLLPPKIRLAISQSRGSALIVAGNIRSANPCGSRNYRRPRSRPSVAFVGAVVPAGACACRRAAPHTDRASPTCLKLSSSGPNALWLFRFPMANGNGATVRRVHRPRNASLTNFRAAKKRQVADELMLPTSFLRGGAHGGGPFARVSAGSLLLPFRARAERRSVRCPCNILTPRKWRLVGEPAIGEWILSAGERAPPSKPKP